MGSGELVGKQVAAAQPMGNFSLPVGGKFIAFVECNTTTIETFFGYSGSNAIAVWGIARWSGSLARTQALLCY